MSIHVMQAIRAIRHPHEAFKPIAEDATLGDAVLIYIVYLAILLFAMIVVPFLILGASPYLNMLSLFGLFSGITGIAIVYALMFVFELLMFLVSVFFVHIIAQAFGGKGTFSNLAGCMAHSSIAMAVLVIPIAACSLLSILFVDKAIQLVLLSIMLIWMIALIIWGLMIQGGAVAASHKLTWGAGIGALIVGALIYSLIAFAIIASGAIIISAATRIV